MVLQARVQLTQLLRSDRWRIVVEGYVVEERFDDIHPLLPGKPVDLIEQAFLVLSIIARYAPRPAFHTGAPPNPEAAAVPERLEQATPFGLPL